jgi:prepilin-type processing-associated H-X9-DG protein
MSNMRQIGQGFFTYASRGGTIYPPTSYTGAAGVNYQWFHVIMPDLISTNGVVKNTKIMWCGNSWKYPGSNTLLSSGNVSYGYNSIGLGGLKNSNGGVTTSAGGIRDQMIAERPWLWEPARMGKLKRGSEVMLVAEAQIYGSFWTDWRYMTSWGDQFNGQLINRHKNACNVLWGDGHVEPIFSTNGKSSGLYEAKTLGKCPRNWLPSTAYPYAWARPQ